MVWWPVWNPNGLVSLFQTHWSLGAKRYRHSSLFFAQQMSRHESQGPAASILGVSTARGLLSGGEVDPLREVMSSLHPPPTRKPAYEMIAEALVGFRYNKLNKAQCQRRLVVKDSVTHTMRLNHPSLRKEHLQCVQGGPNSIRWAMKHGKLKSDSVDSRLLQEVIERPELPPAVGDHVMVLLKEKAQRIIDDDDDSSSED